MSGINISHQKPLDPEAAVIETEQIADGGDTCPAQCGTALDAPIEVQTVKFSGDPTRSVCVDREHVGRVARARVSRSALLARIKANSLVAMMMLDVVPARELERVIEGLFIFEDPIKSNLDSVQ